ncbi:LysR family transcriptional regulator [Microvirga aerilata]|uniref:LysR family transcriptional regulator n=2 Tax=Microvirga aerilata TaxID=670292 RepID=A0A936Z810_9HYPH|nr:LysR family transcriptional regulator [Microvirga aerilata]
MPKPLELDLLRTLIAVAETGSFSNAGLRIGRSQSAVSMQIQRLEGIVGKELLVRGGQKVVPNRLGTDLLAYARRLLKLSEEALASVTQPEVSGTVRLGVPEDYAASLLPSILEQFGRDFPLVTVELVCEPSTSLARTVGADEIDIAIVTRSHDIPVEVLRREPMAWVASPHHAVWENDPLPVALFQTCTARTNILAALAEAERSYRCTYSSASLAGMTAIVQAGLAVAGLALCSVPPSLKIIGDREGLPPIPELEIGIIRGSNHKNVAAARLHDALRYGLAHADPALPHVQG